MWSHPERPANENMENSSVDKVGQRQQTKSTTESSPLNETDLVIGMTPTLVLFS